MINFVFIHQIMNMSCKIRKAQESDAQRVPEIMLQAMEDIIFQFIQNEDRTEAILFLTHFFGQKGNLYSYENTFVAIDAHENIVGSLTGYDADEFVKLREPILAYIKERYGNPMVPEVETIGNEFYIDSIAVAAIARGKGVGTELLQFAIDQAQQQDFKQVGLLVDLENPGAQKLYERIGFKLGKKTALVGGVYNHMYIQLP